jgi:hypothetical protein
MFISLLVTYLLASFAIVGGNVMSVDLGSDSMKIAIVQPGMPMEIGMFLPIFHGI